MTPRDRRVLATLAALFGCLVVSAMLVSDALAVALAVAGLVLMLPGEKK